MKFSLKGILSITMILSIMILFFSCGNKIANSKLSGGSNKVIATIDGNEIVNSDIQKRFGSSWTKQYEQMTASGREMSDEDLLAEKKRLKDNILKDFIFWEKVNLFLLNKGQEVSQELIDEQLEQIIFFNDYKSIDDFYADQLKTNDISKEEIVKQIKDGIGINRYIATSIKENPEAVLIEDGEIQEYYDQIKEQSFSKPESFDISVITIDYKNENEESTPEVKNASLFIDDAYVLADEIIADLNSGIDFEKLAKNNSDSYTKEDGALFRKNFNKASSYPLVGDDLENITSLAQGEYSSVIDHSMNKYLAIYKIDDINPAKVISFEKIQNSIEEKMIINKNRNLVQLYIDKIENGFEVVITEDEKKEPLPESIFNGEQADENGEQADENGEKTDETSEAQKE